MITRPGNSIIENIPNKGFLHKPIFVTVQPATRAIMNVQAKSFFWLRGQFYGWSSSILPGKGVLACPVFRQTQADCVFCRMKGGINECDRSGAATWWCRAQPGKLKANTVVIRCILFHYWFKFLQLCNRVTHIHSQELAPVEK